MAENADTSISADSSGDDSSPRVASAASAMESNAAAWSGRVDFYILEDASPTARLKLACKLAEKAYLASQTVLVWHTDPAELRVFDELLWTFNDGSFVPHETLVNGAVDAGGAPVALSAGVTLSANVDIIINLAAELPACLAQTRRVAEIIDGDDTRRRAGRARFKAYRELGVQPASHNIRAD